MSSPYSTVKLLVGARAIGSLLLMACGFLLTRSGPIGAVAGILLAIWGCLQAARNFGLWIRIAAAEQILRTGPRTRLEQEFQRASLPRKIFHLLYAVAEIDGTAGPRERELVRQFLLERFQRPDLAAEIRDWQARALPVDQVHVLVHELRAMLSIPECETVFSWCCHVAMIDQKFKAIEHDLLQRIARHLGLPGYHARRIFLHAKMRILGAEGAWGGAGGSGSDQGRRSYGGGYYTGGSTRTMPARDQALRVLGLPTDASREDIRKRHRELVKKYHPDAHKHLGEIAAKEAVERFHEVQQAYETLTG